MGGMSSEKKLSDERSVSKAGGWVGVDGCGWMGVGVDGCGWV